MICKRVNEPTQLAKNMKIIEYVERVIYKNKNPESVFTSMVTPKGQVYIINRLIKEINNQDVSA